jgi:two-component system, NtrC family, response regulator HydG
MKGNILVADDDDGVRYMLTGLIEAAGHSVVAVKDGQEALDRVGRERFDVLVSDLRMPVLDGMALLDRLRTAELDAEHGGPRVVMVTAHGSERLAVEAMRRGAYDWFRKPFDEDELLAVIDRALEAARLAAENERLSGELNLSRSLLFASPAMSRLAVLINRVAPKDVTVLISGESGTGKERIAEAIVRASQRGHKPFVRFNCAALTPELAEAELFGHTKGAFTGAHRARPGLFREADGGTLLLDELGELAPAVQAKLLRVLQEGEVRPVGDERAYPIDVRIVGATHRDLGELVRAGQFREDLHYRLKVVQLRVPPLRERPEDIPLLAREFLRRACERFGLAPIAPTPALLARLGAYAWPGNVRELENALESAVALSDDGQLDLASLPETGAAAEVAPATDAAPGAGAAALDEHAPLKTRVDAYERGLVVAALQAARGNRSEAARRLGIARATLHEKMNRYGLG